MSMRSKTLLLFQDLADEMRFVHSLRNVIPSLTLIDGTFWPSGEPETRTSLTDCHSPAVLLWDKEAFERLPSTRVEGGYVGPSTGSVVQWIRCARDENGIVSGRLASSIDTADPSETGFTESVWKVARTCLPYKAIDKGRSGGRVVRAGRGAAEAYRNGLELRLDATFVLYDIVE